MASLVSIYSTWARTTALGLQTWRSIKEYTNDGLVQPVSILYLRALLDAETLCVRNPYVPHGKPPELYRRMLAGEEVPLQNAIADGSLRSGLQLERRLGRAQGRLGARGRGGRGRRALAIQDDEVEEEIVCAVEDGEGGVFGRYVGRSFERTG